MKESVRTTKFVVYGNTLVP